MTTTETGSLNEAVVKGVYEAVKAHRDGLMTDWELCCRLWVEIKDAEEPPTEAESFAHTALEL